MSTVSYKDLLLLLMIITFWLLCEFHTNDSIQRAYKADWRYDERMREIYVCVVRNLLYKETTARNASLLPTERNDDLATVYSLSPKQKQSNNNNNSNELQQQQSNNEYSIKRATLALRLPLPFERGSNRAWGALVCRSPSLRVSSSLPLLGGSGEKWGRQRFPLSLRCDISLLIELWPTESLQSQSTSLPAALPLPLPVQL